MELSLVDGQFVSEDSTVHDLPATIEAIPWVTATQYPPPHQYVVLQRCPWSHHFDGRRYWRIPSGGAGWLDANSVARSASRAGRTGPAKRAAGAGDPPSGYAIRPHYAAGWHRDLGATSCRCVKRRGGKILVVIRPDRDLQDCRRCRHQTSTTPSRLSRRVSAREASDQGQAMYSPTHL